MTEETQPPRFWLKAGGLGLALVALSAATGWSAARYGGAAIASPDIAQVREALKLRLPKTPIDAIDCKDLAGLCEVASKTTLFYVDHKAKYLVIGRIYDMEARQDLTAARLLALNPDLLAAGAAKRSPAQDDGAPPPRATPAKVSLSELDPKGAIHWGPINGPKAIVFSDFNCSYCKKLETELIAIGARVEERPISILSKESRTLAEGVLCADAPATALRKAYAGQTLTPAKACDTKGLDANEAFAKAHGFGGTPVIVRPSDGAVLEGYRAGPELKAFLISTTAPTKG
ncbi:DsbC family protein [Sphingorhabdus sp.]|uniref:DsbC family protein n=1 Tax=Sphingorhabdus sp. TaxID=1902408 RepID=UPI0035B4A880